MTVSNESESVNRAGNAAHADLNERAAAAARAELRGERENMLGAIGTAGPAPLARARDVPERLDVSVRHGADGGELSHSLAPAAADAAEGLHQFHADLS